MRPVPMTMSSVFTLAACLVVACAPPENDGRSWSDGFDTSLLAAPPLEEGLDGDLDLGETDGGLPELGGIVGGITATDGNQDWMVWFNGCGGTLISDSWIMTAAHCTPSIGDTAYIGGYTQSGMFAGTSGESRTLDSVTCHPSYSGNDYDYCLVHVSSPSTKTPIAIDVGTSDHAGENSVVLGWGTTSFGGSDSETLLEVTVPVVTNAVCNASYGGITDRMICAGLAAGGIDSCQGDSGGPLVNAARDALIGVVSFGNGCALPNFYGVYARVSDQSAWVCTTTSDEAIGCAATVVCGDGAIGAGETCDDGNTTAGDGCGATCLTEWRWGRAGQ